MFLVDGDKYGYLGRVSLFNVASQSKSIFKQVLPYYHPPFPIRDNSLRDMGESQTKFGLPLRMFLLSRDSIHIGIVFLLGEVCHPSVLLREIEERIMGFQAVSMMELVYLNTCALTLTMLLI